MEPDSRDPNHEPTIQYRKVFPDAPVLSDEQKHWLNEKTAKLRSENEQYLRSKPEVKIVIDDFLKKCLEKKPSNILHFAGGYFSDSQLRDKVDLCSIEPGEFEYGHEASNKKIQRLKERQARRDEQDALNKEAHSKAPKKGMLDAQTISYISRLTNFDNLEMEQVADAFAANAVDGKLSQHNFHQCFMSLIPAEARQISTDVDYDNKLKAISDFLFQLFDRYGDGDETVEYSELALGLALFCKGDRQAKLRQSFTMLDTDKSGFIDKNEMLVALRPFFIMSYGGSSISTEKEFMNELKVSVDELFAGADVDKDGKLDLEEFIMMSSKESSNGAHNVFKWLDYLEHHDSAETEKTIGVNLGTEIINEFSRTMASTLAVLDTDLDHEQKLAQLERLLARHRIHFTKLGQTKNNLGQFGKDKCTETQFELLLESDQMEAFVGLERRWKEYTKFDGSVAVSIANVLLSLNNLKTLANEDIAEKANWGKTLEPTGEDMTYYHKHYLMFRQPLAEPVMLLDDQGVEVPDMGGFVIPGGCFEGLDTKEESFAQDVKQFSQFYGADPVASFYCYTSSVHDLRRRVMEEIHTLGWNIIYAKGESESKFCSMVVRSPDLLNVSVVWAGVDGDIAFAVILMPQDAMILTCDEEGSMSCITDSVSSELLPAFKQSVHTQQGEEGPFSVRIKFTSGLEDDGIRDIGDFAEITHLDFSHCSRLVNIDETMSITGLKKMNISHSAVTDLCALAELRQLEEFTARGLSLFSKTPIDIQHLQACSKLKYCDFGGTFIKNEKIGFKNKAQLESLILSNSGVSECNWLASMFKLKMLNINGCSKITTINSLNNIPLVSLYMDHVKDVDMKVIASLKDLEVLTIRHNATKTLDFLRSCTHLKSVVASFCVKLVDISSLFGKHELDNVDLSFTKVTELSAFMSADFGTQHGIRMLDLTGTHIEDLKALGSQTSLKELRLSGTKVHSQTLKFLGSCKELELLDIRDTKVQLVRELEAFNWLKVLCLPSSVSEESVERIRKRLPHTSIHYLEDFDPSNRLVHVLGAKNISP